MSDLDAGRLRAVLPGWVPEVRYLAETDSTNRRALEWAAAGAGHGSVVVADHQTAGRGRLDRSWLSPPGAGLLLSVVLRPRLEPHRRAVLGLAAAVAVCRASEAMGVAARARWPNDVTAGGRKLAGILAEATPEAVVLGVGVNVAEAPLPEGIAAAATNLERLTGRTPDRAAVAGRLFAHLPELVDGSADRILADFAEWCETLGRRVRVELADGVVRDRAIGVDAAGRLLLEGGRSVSAGDVVLLR